MARYFPLCKPLACPPTECVAPGVRFGMEPGRWMVCFRPGTRGGDRAEPDQRCQHRVQLWMDAEIWQQDSFLCHPLVNTATLLLSRSFQKRFFELCGHLIHLVELGISGS